MCPESEGCDGTCLKGRRALSPSSSFLRFIVGAKQARRYVESRLGSREGKPSFEAPFKRQRQCVCAAGARCLSSMPKAGFGGTWQQKLPLNSVLSLERSRQRM